MSCTLGGLCQKFIWIEKLDVALNIDTNKNQNLELLLSAADFHFSVALKMFLYALVSTSRRCKNLYHWKIFDKI